MPLPKFHKLLRSFTIFQDVQIKAIQSIPINSYEIWAEVCICNSRQLLYFNFVLKRSIRTCNRMILVIIVFIHFSNADFRCCFNPRNELIFIGFA